jgi:hypothetical protein
MGLINVYYCNVNIIGAGIICICTDHVQSFVSVRLSFPSANEQIQTRKGKWMNEWTPYEVEIIGTCVIAGWCSFLCFNPRNLRRFETYVTMQLEAKLVPHYVIYYMIVYCKNITLHYTTLHYIPFHYITLYIYSWKLPPPSGFTQRNPLMIAA